MSKKTGRLTKVEKFYIDNNPDMEISAIAKDLGRTEKVVKNRRKSNPSEPSDSEGHVVKTNHYPKHPYKDMLGHKENRGVTIMSPEASEIADKTRHKRVNVPERNANSIHVINKDKE